MIGAINTKQFPGVVEVMRTLVICITLLAMTGCGSHHLPIAKTHGTVSLDGKPLSHGMVIFSPERGRAATGQIGSDGSFTLRTYKSRDGALIGKHHVAVVCTIPNPDANFNDPDSLILWKIPRHYGSPATSGLTFEVKPGIANVVKLELKK